MLSATATQTCYDCDCWLCCMTACCLCQHSGAAAEPPVPADSGRAGFSLLSGTGNGDSGHVPHSHQTGSEAVPQACKCLSSKKTYVYHQSWQLPSLLTEVFLLPFLLGARSTFGCYAELQPPAALWAQVSGLKGGKPREVRLRAQEALGPADWHLSAAGLCPLR